MQSKHILVRFGIVTLSLVVIAGCSLFPLGNPFLGEWETNDPFTGTVATTSFARDMTFTETYTDSDGVEQTDTGTYEHDDEVLTLNYDDSETVEFFYEFKEDGDTMVLTLAEGLSLSVTYRRAE